MENQEKIQDRSYKAMDSTFYQDNIPISITAKLATHHGQYGSTSTWEISLWDSESKSHIYRGNLREAIELILLGKLMLAETQEKAREPEYHGLAQLGKTAQDEIQAVCELEKVNHSS